MKGTLALFLIVTFTAHLDQDPESLLSENLQLSVQSLAQKWSAKVKPRGKKPLSIDTLFDSSCQGLKMLRFFLVLLLMTSAHAETLSGHIIGVNDGDTATLLTTDRKPVKIRLWQIDAPERDQAFGEKSKQSLSDLIYRKDVTVQVDTQDQYGRSVGKVFVGGMDVNLEQIKRGMAWFYTQYGSDEKYRAAEQQAKAAKYGLWIDPAAEAPWQWRASGKTSRPTAVNPPASNLPAPSKTATNNPPAIVSNYRCDGRQYCSQMSSCAEATYFIQHCPNVKMDGNNDGIPCEKQWCK